MNDIWAVILAAGSGVRLAGASGGVRKQYLPLRGRPLFWHSARTFARLPRITGLVFVFPPADLAAMREELRALFAAEDLGVPYLAVAGGERRQDSVRSGIGALPRECGLVLVHDAARPFASAAVAQNVVAALDHGAIAAIPAVPVTDTVKRVRDGLAIETLTRDELAAVQTPQGFALASLREAHERAQAQGWDVTDDAALIERLGLPVRVVAGEEANVKITTPEDLRHLSAGDAPRFPCVGYGYDVHRYGPGRPFVLGGVPIPNAPQVVAHSDGDVLLHALIDAVLGCLCLGDIGQHFPDTDQKYAGLDSAILLAEVLAKAERADLRIEHADLTVVAQTPKVAPHRAEISANVARLLGLDPSRVNLKATTEEGLGFTGEKKGIKAVAVVTASRPAAA
jgi:2-C-methyl-D-erythritol 4-phosphate cytidylyltransferase/2-C-methyl-D-erythritol 2,4-cyclodiphosphate synthase